MTKEEIKEYMKAYYQAHKEELKEKMKAYDRSHKEEIKVYKKAWYEAHKEERKEYMKEYSKEYIKSDLNSFGQSKNNIRSKSRRYLYKYGKKIPGYQIHHCCTYAEPYKFIYCSKEIHHLIHSYLRQHNIDADSNHYEQIKHLLDDSVFLYNI